MEDIQKITAYGVLSAPALVIDGVVKVAGEIPKPEEIKKWINDCGLKGKAPASSLRQEPKIKVQKFAIGDIKERRFAHEGIERLL